MRIGLASAMRSPEWLAMASYGARQRRSGMSLAGDEKVRSALAKRARTACRAKGRTLQPASETSNLTSASK